MVAAALTGTPRNEDVGSVGITVTAKDPSSTMVMGHFTLGIANVNDAPVVANPIPDQEATEDAGFSFAFAANTFADVDAGDSLTYSASGLPGWLSFTAGTRTFSDTPTNADVGSVDVTVTAKDGSDATATDTFKITVANTNDAPTVANPIADQSAIEDEAFSFVVPANVFADVDVGDTLTLTATLADGSPLPAG